MPLHWNPETTSNELVTCNYWGRKGAKRAVLAREINLDEIIEIKENAKVEIEVQVHGMMNMFQSKRSLLGIISNIKEKRWKLKTVKKKKICFYMIKNEK